MSCWYPGAKSLTQFWENILTKKQQFRPMIDDRLPLAEYFDADRKAEDKTYGKYAAYVDGFEFDWLGRKIPQKAVETTDIVHWLHWVEQTPPPVMKYVVSYQIIAAKKFLEFPHILI